MAEDQMFTEVFNEKSLKSAIYSAILMALIDRELHELEWKVILAFVDKHWLDEYEDFDQYQENIKKKIVKEVEPLIDNPKLLNKKIEMIVEDLIPDLTLPQKNMVLNLVGDVMVADGIMTLDESKLFAIFMDKMGLQIY
ncbi:MAG: hypothetical protein HQ517_14010 [SAR324 cluster bacterium]|nr:hypothetical protein [SAR324 cluster bacterium]